jgi:SagB-type dehydrogenase family enzyme
VDEDAPVIPTSLTLSLRPDASVTRDGDEMIIRGTEPPAVVRLKQVTGALHAALAKLSDGGISDDDLHAAAFAAEGAGGPLKLAIYLKRLGAATLLRRTLRVGDQPFASIEPMSSRFVWMPSAPEGALLRLSPFACCRRDGDAMVVESPLAPARVVLHDPRAVAALGALATGLAHESWRADLPADAGQTLLGMLWSAGALEPAVADTTSPQARALAQWEFHDLLFHARARLGRHNRPWGARFPYVGAIEPQPAIKPPMSGERIRLARPDLDTLSERDMPLSRALETRRSDRTFGDPPITLDQIGEFLYRVGRVKSVGNGKFGQIIRKPSPSGGGLHEIEIYPVIARCGDVEPGLYHYAAADHELERVRTLTPDVQALLDDAWEASGRHDKPQVLLVLAARFQRVQWKYRMVSYALTLKHVGVLYQTMYLVATAMGLGGCALGGGDADRFAEAAGLGYYEEGSVGEFMLGTRA